MRTALSSVTFLDPFRGMRGAPRRGSRGAWGMTGMQDTELNGKSPPCVRSQTDPAPFLILLCGLSPGCPDGTGRQNWETALVVSCLLLRNE